MAPLTLEETIKTCKVVSHQKSQHKQYIGEDIVLSGKDFPFLLEKDHVEICFVDQDQNTVRLFFKVGRGGLRDDISQKDFVSLDQGILTAFQLRPYFDARVCKISPKSIELDSVELTFKDQYIGRSEMWRLKTDLDEKCLYVGEKLEFSLIRCQVHELWSQGIKVSSGIVAQNTKIVYRSSTSMVYLFIQMSSEMWEFDIYGDLYFEKAVNGFLSDLFARWKRSSCNHEVTIVLFSRLFYNCSSIEKFPEEMRTCLSTDYQGRFYEDFYRVVIQNEKYEDWRNTIINLRQIFVGYHDSLVNFHRTKYSSKIPKATVSSASQGNFLEVLNMSLNVFEKHFVDRSFDRTGQLSVVITPGVGVFEVDRNLTNITMQRLIDNGVGSDLVCVGEQPLHAVPLLKFHNKTAYCTDVGYSMPHWINLSFYSNRKQVGYSSYVPRIKLPTRTIAQKATRILDNSFRNHSPRYSISVSRIGDEAVWPNSIYDFESYDENIFKSLSTHNHAVKKRLRQYKRPKTLLDGEFGNLRQNLDTDTLPSPSSTSSARVSSSLVLPPTQPSSAITIPSRSIRSMSFSSSFGALNIETKHRGAAASHTDKWLSDDTNIQRIQDNSSPSVSSHGGSPKENDLKNDAKRYSKSLINPFDPSHTVIKLTSNRRRWTHIFPRGPSGSFMQQHHVTMSTKKLAMVPEGEVTMINSEFGRYKRVPLDSVDVVPENSKVTKLWGVTGEQDWTPALTTGVDWKSVTIPACLPLTTDYFPDERSLKTDYLVSYYNLLPDDVNADYSSQRAVYRRPLTTKEVFVELLAQRLAQGFQCVIKPRQEKNYVKQQSSIMRSTLSEENVEEYCLSIGRIFHRISLCNSTITVTRYRPKHPYPSINIPYKYRLYAPNNNTYEVASVNFTTEKLENYNWNYVDHYICTRGDRDYALTDNLKYWRFRMFLLPNNAVIMKKMLGEGVTEYNAFENFSLEEKKAIVVDFLKFVETGINRIRKPNNSVPKGCHRGPSGSSQGSNSSSGGFRERVNSNQLIDRPRARSGSKLIDKQKHESSNGRMSPFDNKENIKGIVNISSDGNSEVPTADSLECPQTPSKILKTTSSFQEIISAMRGQPVGFTFIKSSDLPSWTFLSYDAVVWLLDNMEGVNTDEDAIKIFSNMLDEKLILHASGDWKHKFLNGFYLYYITTSDSNGLTLEPHAFSHLSSCSLFHNEWMEVVFPRHCTLEDDIIKKSLVDDYDLNLLNQIHTNFKEVYVDIDVNKKSDRQEWGHLRYPSCFRPDEAFEVTIQWLQATGSIITDLIQGWVRKAQQCNLQLIPVPTDPIVLRTVQNPDPLRGPITIPVAVHFIKEEFGLTELSWQNITYFQHLICQKFGFVRAPRYTPQGSLNKQPQQATVYYVHFSGNMFIVIPDYSIQQDIKVEFLWSWNYMVGKRWKTASNPALGDDGFMFKVLADFRAFCSNENNRLVTSWRSVWTDNSDSFRQVEEMPDVVRSSQIE